MSNLTKKKLPNDIFRFTVSPKFSIGQRIEKAENGVTWTEYPVKMKIRSGKPIFSQWYGAIVHDHDGLVIPSKGSVAIDYVHDDTNIDHAIGRLDHFFVENGDLWASGVLVSFKEDDVAGKLAKQIVAKIPYQASIFFDDPEDGEIEWREVGKNSSDNVNGNDLPGPALIFTKWMLRGVAVCLYGRDSNTSMELQKYKFTNEEVEFMPNVTNTQTTDKEKIQEFTDAFGAETGLKYYLDGKEFSEAMKIQYKELREKYSALEKEFSEKMSENSGKTAETIAELQDKLSQSESEKGELQKKFSESESKIEDLEKKVAVFEKNYSGAEPGKPVESEPVKNKGGQYAREKFAEAIHHSFQK